MRNINRIVMHSISGGNNQTTKNTQQKGETKTPLSFCIFVIWEPLTGGMRI